jgi:hypothetical protein
VARSLVTVLVLSLTALVAGVAAPAQAQTLYGHDISWPQCPSAQGGFGLPLPPTSTQFVIIGLTRGLAFTENPCVADQVAWTVRNGKPTHAYAMATFPTASQLTTYGSRGPWQGGTRADRLRNVGYSEARFALQTLARIGWSPPVVWIDVEPRPAQPWPSSTSQERLENRYVIAGLMQGLREAGVGVGLYSYTAGWQAITDGWRLPGVPVWATAGRLDYPTEAQDRCVQPSFSGGPVRISQWYDDTRDYDLTCGSYGFSSFGASAFHLANRLGGPTDVSFHYGDATGKAYIGDWNGDRVDTPAVRNGSTFRIRQSNTVGLADVTLAYGRVGDEILVADWDGNGTDTLTVRRGNTYYIKNDLSGGPADTVVAYGRATDEVLVGDWDGNGTDTLTVRRGRTFYVKNSLTGGPADAVVDYGLAGDTAFAGDWNGDNSDSLGIRRVS